MWVVVGMFFAADVFILFGLLLVIGLFIGVADALGAVCTRIGPTLHSVTTLIGRITSALPMWYWTWLAIGLVGSVVVMILYVRLAERWFPNDTRTHRALTQLMGLPVGLLFHATCLWGFGFPALVALGLYPIYGH